MQTQEGGRLMRLFSREDLQQLAQSSGGYHISIYLPTHSAGIEAEQNPIRFKNLIRRAEEELEAEGVRTPEIKSILDPAYQLLSNHFFWKHQRKGLALFIGPEQNEYYRTTHTFRELAIVTHRFHLKPLLPLLSREEQFYILAISQNQVRLLQCNRDQVIELEVEAMPSNISEAMNEKDQETHMHHHYVGSGGKGDQTSVLHGGGDGSDSDKENLKKFFRLIDQNINKMLRNNPEPLILATVDANFPIYKEINSYPTLFDENIPGNPDNLDSEQLLEKGFALIRPYFKQERSEAEEKYHHLNGTGKTSHELKDVVLASHHGQIDTLFVAREVEQWGNVDQISNQVILHDQFEPGDEDLLSYASIQTLIHKGRVFSTKPEFMPDKSNIAAIFRY